MSTSPEGDEGRGVQQLVRRGGRGSIGTAWAKRGREDDNPEHDDSRGRTDTGRGGWLEFFFMSLVAVYTLHSLIQGPVSWSVLKTS